MKLRYAADKRSLAFIGLLAALYAAQYTGWVRHPFLFALTCVLSFVAFIVRHNHIHCPTFAERQWNQAMDWILALLTGQPTEGIIAIHNERHHGQAHSDEDGVRSTLVAFRHNWINLVLFFFAAARNVRRKKRMDLMHWRKEHPPRFRRYCVEQAMLIASYFLLALWDWRSALVFIGIPFLFGQWCIVTINLLQHQGCDHESKYNHSRNITGTFVNWLFLNNGFHTAHHLRPALHWSLLPDYHRKQVHGWMRADLNQCSLFASIWRQFFRNNV